MKSGIQWLLLFFSLAISVAVMARDTFANLALESQTALEQGRYSHAADLLSALEQQANQSHDAYWQTWAQMLQSNLALQQRQFDHAEHQLNNAHVTAQNHAWPELIARISLYRGQLRQNTGQWPEAEQDYLAAEQESAKILPEIQASAILHRAALSQQRQIFFDSAKLLQTAEELISRLPENPNRIHLTLDVGYQWLQLREIAPTAASLETVYNALSTALQYAKKSHLDRQMAQSLGYLSELYSLENRSGDAIDLLQQAVFYGQQSQSRDLLLHFEWQLARQYAQQGQLDVAIAAYRRAVGHIQALRQDIPVTYENGRSSFRDTLAPAYLELAGLLFDKAKQSSPQQRQALLQEAQRTVEQIKKSELEDYFQNRCELPPHSLDTCNLPEKTAALYPVIFPTHLDLLLLTKQGLHHFSTPVQQSELQELINNFSAHMQAYDADYLASANQLYQYLMQPIAAILQSQHINTLIYIPDGALRLVPLSALYDGQHYVLEAMAVVISPGLSISRSEQSDTQQGKILLAGLSEPGSVVNELPSSLVQELLPSSEPILTVRGKINKLHGIKLRTLLIDRSATQQLQSSLALPSVTKEMMSISSQLPESIPLINQAFTLQDFSDQVRNNSYKIVHIASHGFFDGTEQNSFIMTYDHILTMNHLDTLFNNQQPPDLLVLSACQTAEGNDRSPLGISGVLIKAKVKSVLGSLWPVSDEATTLLMEHFYRYLKQGMSKAEALRQAQLVVMQRKEFAAASFWSPFILVGEIR